jgi:hypothetical protein
MYTGLNAQETVIYAVLVALHDQLLQRFVEQLPVCVVVIGLIGLVVARRVAFRSSK